MITTTLQRFEKEYKAKTYNADSTDLQAKLKDFAELKQIVPATIEITVSRGSTRGTWCYEHSRIILDHDFLRLEVNHNGKWYINDRTKYPGTNYYDKRLGEEPNQIGMLSKKKIQDWIDYYEKSYQYLKDRGQNRINELKKVMDKIAELKKKGAKVIEANGNVWVQRGGLEFCLTVQDGIIADQRIRTYRCGSNIETFATMSNNKYVSNDKD